jgi:sarcosine oxidase subunit alpha
MRRLPPQPGERIDRSRPLTFSFDGRSVEGFEGDTIASALLASGRTVLSRSFKYHRPRGELCGCGQCAGSLVAADGRPGVRACAEPVTPGMRVEHQNAWPSLRFDAMRATDRIGGPFTPVGFYYKTFIRPRRLWPTYERILRRAAGLGRLPDRQEDREWETSYRRRHCDLLVIGGGVAGLRAAVAGARAGLDVVLCDEDHAPGGLALLEDPTLAAELLRSAQAAGVEILSRASALGWFSGIVPVWQGSVLHQVRAQRYVLATGALQQPLVFHDNDLPGVMLSGGARRLAALYGVKPGECAVVTTVDDRGLQDALALQALGVEVALVADLRERPADGALAERLAQQGVDVLHGAAVVRASGRDRVAGATVAHVRPDGRAVEGSARTVACDLIAVSGGSQPALSLLLQAGGSAGYDPARGMFAVSGVPGGIEVAGALAGEGLSPALPPPGLLTDGGRGKCFIDLDEDVTTKDISRAAAEGYDSLELSKRYTTVTMGPSQGRFSQVPSARYLAEVTGVSLDDVGLTTARPPWLTVPLAALAGRPFEPAKRSALHARHRELRANVRWAGDWRRSYDYGDAQSEVLAVHSAAGLIDVSTLGKLLVRGPQAGELLDRLYPNRMSSLPVGRIRYGVMLSEAGRITDDGTVCRLDEQTFYVTTTSAGAGAVAQQLTWWLEAWRLDAHVTDLTQGVAAMNLAGPHARTLLGELTTLDCSPESFRYLDARQAQVADVPALLLRIGFVGELGYEIHCAAPQAGHLWETILATGDVTPFGLEAQRVLRLHKQHVIVGQDTDSEATPFTAGLDWIVQLDDGRDFIGRWALEQRKGQLPPTKLVGFTVPSGAVMTEGAVVLRDGQATGCQVTSARWSPQLEASIGLATVPAELAGDGAQIEISYAGVTHLARVQTRPFYDPDGEVLRS